MNDMYYIGLDVHKKTIASEALQQRAGCKANNFPSKGSKGEFFS
jgi:hypothetical protein